MNREEAILQTSMVVWLNNEHPETRGLFFAVQNNSENKIRGTLRKSEGLRAGVSDTLFFWDQTVYCIEVKTATGKQSPAQIRWQKTVEKNGYYYFVVRSLTEFKRLIELILSGHFKRI